MISFHTLTIPIHIGQVPVIVDRNICMLFYISLGYYTSRPGLKGYAREMNSLLQSCKQFEVQFEGLGLWKHTNFSFTNLKLAVALNQHHDAIT